MAKRKSTLTEPTPAQAYRTLLSWRVRDTFPELTKQKARLPNKKTISLEHWTILYQHQQTLHKHLLDELKGVLSLFPPSHNKWNKITDHTQTNCALVILGRYLTQEDLTVSNLLRCIELGIELLSLTKKES